MARTGPWVVAALFPVARALADAGALAVGALVLAGAVAVRLLELEDPEPHAPSASAAAMPVIAGRIAA